MRAETKASLSKRQRLHFRGIARTFDGAGNYTLGLKEQTIFPEIVPDHIKKSQGMDITIVTSTEKDEEALELLKLLGMPFANP